MLKCYHLVFSSKIKKNIGIFIISPIILFWIVSMFIFYFYAYKLYQKLIKSIVDIKSLEKTDINGNINNKGNLGINKNKKEDIKNSEIIGNKPSDKSLLKRPIKKKKKARKKSKIKIGVFPPRKSGKFIIDDTNSNIIKINSNNNEKEIKDYAIKNSNEPSVNNINKIPLEILNKNNEENKNKSILDNTIMEYNDSELNLLSYEEAFEVDKRTYIQYYISLIRTKHLLIFSFYSTKDYNSRIITINLFFFTFVVNYAVNALFFNDSTMHKIYLDNGDFNFIYQIPQILYSTIISSVLITIVKLSALSEKNVLKIKKAKREELSEIYMSESNSMYCKFICFFIIVFILLLLFWYSVGCFCAVYKNTQIQLLSDTLLSFTTSLIYPLFLYLIPGIFRIKALKEEEKKHKYMYNFSKIIQMFI